MPSWVPERIREVSPPGWTVDVVGAPVDSSGDGRATVTPAVRRAVRDAKVYVSYGIPAEVLREGRRLEWVHTATAGVNASLTEEMRSSSVIFTNSAGIHGPAIAETVVAMILYFLRGLDHAVDGQARRAWETAPFDGAASRVTELSSCAVGILGYGGIGREVALRVSAMGGRVTALRRGSTDPEGLDVEVVRGESRLERILEESDVLVVALPETSETRGMVGAEALAALPDGAVVVNVSRGGIVDEDAVRSALRSGRLRGAALDVFQREPLPSDDPLWSEEGVLITPHVAGATDRFWPRQVELIEDNLDRFLNHRPLRNVVDEEAGY